MTLHRRLFLLLVALVVGLVAAPAAAQDEESTPSFELLRVHRADARTEGEVSVLALTPDTDVSAGDVSVTVEGQPAEVRSVNRATAAAWRPEVVVVIDTAQRMVAGDGLARVGEALSTALADLPADASVALVRAGDRPVVVSEMGPVADTVAELDRLDFTQDAALLASVARVDDLFSDDLDTFRTVIVVSGGADTNSEVDAVAAGVAVNNAGAQLISVRYQGGEAALSDAVTQSGGTSFSASTADELAAAVATAVELSSERLAIGFARPDLDQLQPTVQLAIGDQTTSFAYLTGQSIERAGLLVPGSVAAADDGFFQTQTGLYLILGLAFVGISLGVYALAGLAGGSESTLDDLIRRYSNDVEGNELSEAEKAVVQTALVQRAADVAESFAADRGFLVKLEGMLEKANVPLRPGEAMTMYAGAVLLAFGLGFVLMGPLGALVIGGIVGFLGFSSLRFLAARRMKKFEAQLPDALQLLSGTLKAGYSLPQGVEAVSHEILDPMGYELRRVMTEARLGRELEEALSASAERLQSPDFAWAVMAIAIQREVGGNLSELLNTVADTMVARERIRGEVRALTAEGKMSAFILGGLPPGLGLVMWVMNPEYINTLFSETLGYVFLAAAALSMTAGGFWMKKVITIDV